MNTDHAALQRWITANRGFIHPDVEVAFTPALGHHVRVKAGKSIAPGTIVAKCSAITSLSVLNVLHTPPFSSRGTRFPLAFIKNGDPTIIQTFFLIEQWLLGDRSWWAPYLRTLPGPDAVGDVFLTESDVPRLQGTNLEKGLANQIASLKKRFHAGKRILEQLKWPRIAQGEYTW